MNKHVVPVMIITGSVGAGKTTTAFEVSEILEARRVPHALVDMDALRWCYPSPPDDPFQTRLAAKNLAAVWDNYRRKGARALVVADVIEARSDLVKYREAVLGANILVVRLRVSTDALAARVVQREVGSGREWHLRRTVELAEIMDRNGVEDLLVETNGKSVIEIATEILDSTGWPNHTHSVDRS